MLSTDLEISVAVMPEGSTTTLSYEMSLIRPALLYGDSVRVYSPALSILLLLDQHRLRTGMEHLGHSMAKAFAMGMDSEYHGLAELVARYIELKDKTSLSEEERNELASFESLDQMLKKGYDNEIRPGVEWQLKEAGYDEVRRAMKEGLLKIEPLLDDQTLILDSDSDMLVRSYFNAVSKVISEPRLFPLLDEFSIKVAQALVADGAVPHTLLSNKHGTEVHLATEIMRLAPSFPRATVWDIVDIRKELGASLTRFRSAALKFSELVHAEVFGPEFVYEAQDLIRKEINPALLEIEECTENNKYLKRLARSASPSIGTVSATGLSLMVGNSYELPAIASAIVATLPSVLASRNVLTSAVNEYWAMREEEREIQHRDLYFVVHMDKALASRASR